MATATAELLSNTTAWLQEGLWLKDMMIRLAGAAPVESYIETRSACRNLPWRPPGGRVSSPEEMRRIARHEEQHRACFTPLVDALNSGRVIAVRPDSNTSEFVRLLPPATGWRFRVFDLEKSLIFDPKRSAQSLFVLFMFVDRVPASAPKPATIVSPVETLDQRRQSSRSKAWLTSTVVKIPPDDFKHGWKRRYARKLAAVMSRESKTDKNLKPLAWTSIYTRLTEHELWPNA